jgi:hypothetical protein
MNSWWVPPSIREISYLMKIRFLPVAKIICVFCLETKGTKSSRNDPSKKSGQALLQPHRAKHLARRSFIPTLGYSATFSIYSF